jgi:hypothetical protein
MAREQEVGKTSLKPKQSHKKLSQQFPLARRPVLVEKPLSIWSAGSGVDHAIGHCERHARRRFTGDHCQGPSGVR